MADIKITLLNSDKSVTNNTNITIDNQTNKKKIPLSQQKKNLSEKVWYVAQAIFLTAEIFVDPFIGFFTQGLSDFLALETLRHGTSFQNYISIRLNGADPTLGGGDTGAIGGINAEYYRKNAKGYFFVTKDSEAFIVEFGSYGAQLYNRWFSSRFYCGLSANAAISGKGFQKTILRILFITFNILFVPTIKFRFRPEDIPGRFVNDPDNRCLKYSERGLAYRTKQPISTDYIGLKGIVKQGLQGDIGARMKAHPIKVCWGLAKLINPIGIFILLGLGAYLAVNKTYHILQGKIKVITNFSDNETLQQLKNQQKTRRKVMSSFDECLLQLTLH